MTRTVQLEEAEALDGVLKHWAYNAADAAGTHEIAGVLLKKLEGNPRAAATYGAERAFQSPAMQVMFRGIRVDTKARTEILNTLDYEIGVGLAEAAELVADIWDGTTKETGLCPKSKRKDGRHTWEKWERNTEETGRACTVCGASRFRLEPFNANSSTQARHLFADLLKVKPALMKNKKGQTSADDEVLDRIGRRLPKLLPIVQAIQNVRDKKKQKGEVNARLDGAGRYRTSLNIGATWTGRSSSSKSPMGLGGNTQNKAERHRRMFIADPGYEMFYADLKQAESLYVAYRADDEAYIAAHVGGDLHTVVCRYLFPDLPWTGDIKTDRKLAESTYAEWDTAPGHNIRFQAKRNTHGYAYGISPDGSARIIHISVKLAQAAHDALDLAFPNIKNNYWPGVRERVENQMPLVTALGREIQIFGRPWDEATFRQGLSAEPQSAIADLVNIAMTLIWRHHDPHLVQVLGNGYDAILGQWRVSDREEALAAVVEAMEIPVLMPSGKTMVIPVEVSVGQNWGKASDANPNGQRGIYG